MRHLQEMWAIIASGVAGGSLEGRLSPQDVAKRTDEIIAEFLKLHPEFKEDDR